MTRLLNRFTAQRALAPDASLSSMYAAFTGTYKSTSTESSLLSSFSSYASEGYKSNAIVFACLNARLLLLSEVTFKYRALSDKRLYGGTDLSLLENPWPNGTTGDLVARMEQDVSLAGNAFIRSAGVSLERLRPDWVDIVSLVSESGARQVAGYVYYRNGRIADKEGEFYSVEDVAHWAPIPDPESSWRGMSWMSPLVREINADTAMTNHKTAFFNNAATPNMILKYPIVLNDTAFKTVSDEFNRTYGGPANAWKTAVLDAGADLTVVGNNFSEMAFTDLQAAGENRIAAAAGVPAVVVGLKEGLAAANIGDWDIAMRRFADLTARPLWRSMSAALSKFANVPSGSQLYYDVSDIAALRQGEVDAAGTMSTLATAASTLLTAGYEPTSVSAALIAKDLSLLVHTGLQSVQLLKANPVAPDSSTPTGASA